MSGLAISVEDAYKKRGHTESSGVQEDNVDIKALIEMVKVSKETGEMTAVRFNIIVEDV